MSGGLRFFRSNAEKLSGPAAVAERTAYERRVEAFDQVQVSAKRVLGSLSSWRPFDSTGHLDGAFGHTLANVADLQEDLAQLQSAISSFRRLKEQGDGEG